VDISGAHFYYDLSLQNGHFAKGVVAGHLKVEGDLSLRETGFMDDVDFSSSQIGGALYMGGAQILTDGKSADFDNAKVGTIAEFSNMDLKGPLILTGADLQIVLLGRDATLHLGNPGKPSEEASLVDLEDVVVHRDMTIQAIGLEKLHAPALEVLGQAVFQDVKITGEADLTNAHFRDLTLGGDVIWPGQESSLRLQGITFSDVSPGSMGGGTAAEARWESLLDNWVDRSAYSPDAYQQLEQAFRRAGRSDLADKTFERMKQRERERGHLSWLGKVWNYILCGVIGYGREPHRALYWGIPIVIIGCFIFRPKHMRVRRVEDEGSVYNAFWYSLELFLPVVTLLAAEIWIPKQDDWLRRNWARIHSLLGWILVPFALAAITGLVSTK